MKPSFSTRMPSRKLAAAVIGTCLSLPYAATAANWSDTSISYRYGEQFNEPAIAKDVSKDIVGFTHVSGHGYGQNFLNVDILMSDKNDPAKGGGTGAQEVYVVYAHQLFMGKVLDRSLSFGPVKEVALTTGFDWNSKDTAFAPKVRKILVGPTLKFDIPKGYFDVSLLFYKEWNNNGIVGKSVNFDSTYRIAMAWGVPFTVASVPLSFEGFLNYTGEKGRDGFGVKTDPETWTDMFIMADVGQMLMGKPRTLRAGIGYEYINNKFGAKEGSTGSETTTPMIKVQWHF
ncbi:hypothetical protein [Azoarcus sp. L1K30]|uniref:hypothetical protein n=1 Tax=Azoarcus sp. L1K30 TaxID=2820277 RepID=UPI00201366EA|nr:hypothetical protein [Azoarcus sp. L1K30]